LLALDRRHVDCPVHDPEEVSGPWPSSPRSVALPAGDWPDKRYFSPARAARLLVSSGRRSERRMWSEDCIVGRSECQSNSPERQARINLMKTVRNRAHFTRCILM
jgi:hypothetical protein